ncbi:unnamed protein product [marine sediment metagenome]|uniref:RNA polymerase sigma-70 region 2 domain-containing protein n=1 Tax=marine sediment metagenome TaxID=412755 RepID=X0T017_9ZZZZ
MLTAEDNMGLAYSETARFVRNYKNRESLRDTLEFSDACLGLVKAAHSFKKERRVKFSTYAVDCIKKSIISGIQYRTYQKRAQSRETKLDLDWGCVLDWRQEASHFEIEEICEILLSGLNTTARDIEIMVEYFQGRKQKDIAKDHDVSQQRIRQIIYDVVIPEIKKRHARFLEKLEKDMRF